MFVKKINNVSYLICFLYLCISNCTCYRIKLQHVYVKKCEVRLLSFSFSDVIFMIKIVKFSHFNDINFDHFDLIKNNVYQSDLYFVFIPDQSVMFDRSLKLDRFFFFSQTKLRAFITIIYLKGLDIDSFDFTFGLKYPKVLVNIVLYVSRFHFYQRDNLLPEEKCNQRLFSKNTYFATVYSISFSYGVSYSRQTCKLIFKNATIFNIYFYNLKKSLIVTNLLSFVPHTLNKSLDCKIGYVYFKTYNVRLDENLVDRQVFKIIRQIQVVGTIDSIEPSLFKGFNYLICIILILSNTRMLFSKGIDWTNYIMMDYLPPVNVSNINLIIKYFSYSTFIKTYTKNFVDKTDEKPYSYPDEDFCWFVNFPFAKLVFLDPHTVCEKNCSCTQYWLLQYVYVINMSTSTKSYFEKYLGIEKPFGYRKYDQEIQSCNFKTRIDNCFKNGMSKFDHKSVRSFQVLL